MAQSDYCKFSFFTTHFSLQVSARARGEKKKGKGKKGGTLKVSATSNLSPTCHHHCFAETLRRCASFTRQRHSDGKKRGKEEGPVVCCGGGGEERGKRGRKGRKKTTSGAPFSEGRHRRPHAGFWRNPAVKKRRKRKRKGKEDY